MLPTFLLALLPTLLATSAPQQTGGDAGGGPVLVSVSDLGVSRYRPQHLDAGELVRLVQQMVGRRLFVAERGGYQSDPVWNVQLIGDTLVLYDTKEYLQRMSAMLAELDLTEGPAPSSPSERVTTWEYTPRYLSLEATYEILQPLRRFLDPGVETRLTATPAGNPTSNISLSEERRLVVVRDSAERVKEIRELLQRVDLPQDQVTITCWLLQGGAGAGEKSGLPAELSEHLARLVPGQAFRRIGFGLLQSSVSTQGPVSMQLADSVNGQPPYHLVLRPMAYDRESGSLSVSGCTLSYAGGGGNSLFSTSAVLRGGEFTVIGASGSDPILVAIRVTPVGK